MSSVPDIKYSCCYIALVMAVTNVCRFNCGSLIFQTGGGNELHNRYADFTYKYVSMVRIYKKLYKNHVISICGDLEQQLQCLGGSTFKFKERIMATSKSTANGADTSGHPMTDKLQSTLHESLDTIAEKAATAEQSLRDSASESAENMAARRRLMKQKWLGSSVRNYAVENPVAAAGITFAAGMLVASLLKKSK